MSYLQESITDGVMLLELDRPPANAMDVELLGELCDVRALERARTLAELPGEVYARSKHDLRASALAQMLAAAARDPLLEAWTDGPASG